MLAQSDKEYLAACLVEKNNRIRYNYIDTLFPETGPLRRELYHKHIDFLNAGLDCQERVIFGGNGTAKTHTGLYEIVKHATGLYPTWWEGRRFAKPGIYWIVGDRGESIRDGIQTDLLGVEEKGTGLIPKDLLVNTTAMLGIPNGVGTYTVKHFNDFGKYDGDSVIIIKTFNAGVKAFKSAHNVNAIHLDETCPLDIYIECQMRMTKTGGTVFLTFTPDEGMTDTVVHLLTKPKPGDPLKFVTFISWDDAPHMTDEVKARLAKTIPPHLFDVKTKGLPYLGRGSVYPIPEDEIVVKPVVIEPWWPRAYGLDVGWHRTAAVWGAQDPNTKIIYLYREYYQGFTQPPVHANAIKGKAPWIKGAIDIAANQTKDDGQQLINQYIEYGLDLITAPKCGEADILYIYDLLSQGKLKIFSTLANWLYEYRLYHRDDDGKVAQKQDDHLMDATKYLLSRFDSIAEAQPEEDSQNYILPTARSVKSLIGGY